MIIGDIMGLDYSMTDRQFGRSVDSRYRMIYPAPFFDPIAIQSIMDPKLLIQWSRFFFEWHPIVHAAIMGMVTYPITDFVYDTTDEAVKKNYQDAFESINMRSILIKAGIDYYVSGATIGSLIMPFIRMLECPTCKYSANIKDRNIRIKPQSKSISYTCPKCGLPSKPKVTDIQTINMKDLKVVLWSPLNMDLDYDEIMGTTDYFVTLPPTVRAGILKGEKKYYENYPMYMIESVYKNMGIKLYRDKVLHMARETHSSSIIKGWGPPLITPSLKYLFHLLVLLKGQDALAIDQILPWTILSPSRSDSVDPAGDQSLGQFQSHTKKEYEEWKRDPLRKSIFPFPVNAQMVGGQGKNLMLHPEIDAITNHVLAGMGVPNEFIFGGLTWSGASVSLRMLENKFINYRTMMNQIISWVSKQIALYAGYPEIPIYMQSFKMADDIAQKQLVMQMRSDGVVSSQYMLSEISPDRNYKKEQETIFEEKKDQIVMERALALMQSKAGLVETGTLEGEEQESGEGNDKKESKESKGGSSASKAKANPEKNPPRSEGGNKQI
jgi:hypothetical protein